MKKTITFLSFLFLFPFLCFADLNWSEPVAIFGRDKHIIYYDVVPVDSDSVMIVATVDTTIYLRYWIDSILSPIDSLFTDRSPRPKSASCVYQSSIGRQWVFATRSTYPFVYAVYNDGFGWVEADLPCEWDWTTIAHCEGPDSTLWLFNNGYGWFPIVWTHFDGSTWTTPEYVGEGDAWALISFARGYEDSLVLWFWNFDPADTSGNTFAFMKTAFSHGEWSPIDTICKTIEAWTFFQGNDSLWFGAIPRCEGDSCFLELLVGDSVGIISIDSVDSFPYNFASVRFYLDSLGFVWVFWEHLFSTGPTEKFLWIARRDDDNWVLVDSFHPESMSVTHNAKPIFFSDSSTPTHIFWWCKAVGDSFATLWGTRHFPLLIHEHLTNTKHRMDIYPNPFEKTINIRLSNSTITKDELSVNVFDISGRKIPFKINSQANKRLQLSLETKMNGIYFIVINIQGNRIIKRAILIND